MFTIFLNIRVNWPVCVILLNMNCRSEDRFERLVNAFGKCGMGVDQMLHVRDCAFESHCGHAFCNHFRDPGSDHVDTEDLPIFFVRDNLDETVSGIFDAGFCNGSEMETFRFNLVTGGDRLCFS